MSTIHNIYIGNDGSCDLLMRAVITLVVVVVLVFIIALIPVIYRYILRKKLLLSLSRELESRSEPTFPGEINRFKYSTWSILIIFLFLKYCNQKIVKT